jgi:hypothetical protein
MNKKHSPLFFFLFAVVIFTEVFWIFNSDGFYFIDDGCHFNFSRHAFTSYTESIGLWHRLGRVWLFALPAQFGLKGIQIFSACISILTIYFSYRILIQKNVPYPEWVIPLVGFQPVFFNVSFTALAELPSACLIILSFYFYLNDKYKLVMILTSLLFIFRMEYFFVSFIFLVIYIYKRRYKSIILFLTGPMLWFFASWIITGRYWQLWRDFLYYSSLPKITAGIDWSYYFLYSPVIFGTLQCIFFLTGASILTFKRKLKDYTLLLIIVAGGFLVQTAMASKTFGISSSIGQLRYLAVIGPVFGIVAAYGFSQFVTWYRKREERIVLSGFVLFFAFLQGPLTVPFHKKLAIENVAEEIVVLADTLSPHSKIITNLYYIANAIDEPASGGQRYLNLTTTNLKNHPNSIIVWLKELDGSPFVPESVTLSGITAIPGISQVASFIDTVNHNYDVPCSIFRNESSEVSRKIFDYFTHDQYCWETFDIRVFKRE